MEKYINGIIYGLYKETYLDGTPYIGLWCREEGQYYNEPYCDVTKNLGGVVTYDYSGTIFLNDIFNRLIDPDVKAWVLDMIQNRGVTCNGVRSGFVHYPRIQLKDHILNLIPRGL